MTTKIPRQIDVETNKHKQKRKNNPAAGLVNQATEPLEQVKMKKYSYDKHLDPELQWTGKKEQTSFEVPTVSLHTHESIDSRAIIERVRKTNTVDYAQESLFKKERSIPKSQDVQFYRHERNWKNRLIAGDSLLVMNSLLEKEGMGGKVQCVYIDPPYGIKYGSNFQPFTNKRDVKDGKDEDLTSEPETLKAFRDTWELGIHSYLSYLRDRLLLARKLLTDSGSCFVQISDENVHLVRSIMDEVFGRENFFSSITFKKTSELKGSGMDGVANYLIWYAKDKVKMKYNQLFFDKPIGKDTGYTWLELEDGKRRKMTFDERRNPNLLPPNSRPFFTSALTSSGYAPSCFYDFKLGDRLFKRGKRAWRTTKNGMEKLIQANRIMASGLIPTFILYHDDFPAQKLHNLWNDTHGASSPTYVVQTSTKVIQRCLLMTTDPGDLVLDPTCGGGTTAYVAEQWGRRWITCDTSRVAITLTKQRLMSAVFDYYKLENPDEGVSRGFQYQKIPHITLKSITNDEPPAEETLYDKPLKDSKKARVTAPFTVEAVPSQAAPRVQSVSNDQEKRAFKYEWLDDVKRSGIRGKKKVTADMNFDQLEIVKGFDYLHAEGDTDNPRRVVISFGSEYAPLDKRQVESATKEAKTLCPDVLVFAAFHFDPEATSLIEASNSNETSDQMKVVQVQMNMDLQTKDLKKKASSNESFWLVGQPDVKVKRVKPKQFSVEVLGFDYYDPATGKILSGGKSKVAMWQLDPDYNGTTVVPQQVFFPMAGTKDGWSKLAKSLKTEIDEELIQSYHSTESLPFPAGDSRKIAVKIIDDRGIESLKIISLPADRGSPTKDKRTKDKKVA